jgi:hypothetical protein
MPCEMYEAGDGGIIFLCSRGRQPLKRCIVCQRSERQRRLKLCDYVVGIARRGKRTCDAPVCAEHAWHQDPDYDLCPAHAREREQTHG